MIIKFTRSRKCLTWITGLTCLLMASVAGANDFNAMMAKARTQGQLPVIVKMKMATADKRPANGRPQFTGFQKPGRPSDPAQASLIGYYQDQLLSRFPQHAGKRVSRFKSIPYLGLSVTPEELASLRDDPEVEFIEEDRLLRPTLNVSIPLIGADQVWAEPFTGAGTAVAIIDSGVDSAHPFLAGRVVSEACYSTTYAPFNATSLCPSDAFGNLVHTGTGTAQPCTIGGCDHGTHVAGIAAGNGTNSGVAKDADIIAIQVFTRFDDPNFCGSSAPCIAAFTSDIISALERVRDLQGSFDIAAANMSLGGGTVSSIATCDADNAATKSIIDQLRSIGIATVIAAGNNGNSTSISGPGCISTAITVGASTDNDAIASFSNSASWLDFLAPGYSILSSLPGGGFGNKSGTSMATPHVTGAWALIKSKRDALLGSLHSEQTVDQIFAALSTAGTPITDTRNDIVTPRIQLNAASDAFAVGQLPPANIILDDLGGSVTSGSFGTTITDSASYGGTAVKSTSTAGNRFRFSADLPNSGFYRVYAWWASDASNTTQAEYNIVHANGQSPLSIDQTISGNRWVDLGAYLFDSETGAAIEISNPSGGGVIADAVRLEYLPDPALTINGWVPQGGLSLASAEVGTAYLANVTTDNSTPPIHWSIVDGGLPPGLSLDPATGDISGTPTAVIDSNFTLRAEDSVGAFAEAQTSINVSGTPISNITASSFSSILSKPDSVGFRIDDSLPNPGVSGAIIGAVPANAFTNNGIGFITDGFYADLTSAQVTSDLVPDTNSISWTFVDATNPANPATVQSVGFYFGSVDEPVTVNFLDLSGNLLDTAVLPTDSTTGSIGFEAPGSEIHSIIFTHSGTDAWVLGSFAESTSLTDISFANQVVVDPSSLNTSLISAPPSPQQAGSTIDFSAQVTGGSGNYEYQFWANGPSTGNTWTIMQAYSSSANWSWATASSDVGSNAIRVWVRETGSTSEYDGTASVGYEIISSAVEITPTSFDALESDPGSIAMIIDTYLPNPGVSGQLIGSIPSDAFTNGGIGLIADGDYGDFTGHQVTSDFAISGTPHTWTFVDPSNPTRKATVSGLAFRLGSVSEPINATFLDVDGNVIDTATIAPVGTTGSIGFSTTQSIIHSVQFSQPGDDLWLIGSFAQSPSLNDILLSGFTISATTVALTLNPTLSSPQLEGTAVTFTAQPDDGLSYDYQFWLRGPATGDSWVVVQDYSSSNSWTWDTLGDTGKNSIRVRARLQNSDLVYDGSTSLDFEILSATPKIATTTFDAVQNATNSTSVVIDTYLPNPGVSGQLIGSIPSDAFTNGGIGLIADGDYGDFTSHQVTSDFAISGTPHTWTFVDPSNPTRKATVSGLAFRLGSVSETINATFLDVDGNVIDTATIAPVGPTGSIGFSTTQSIIHSVQFSQPSNDLWLIGSFAQSTSLNDIVFTEFTIQ